jgi:hypothetical protein
MTFINKKIYVVWGVLPRDEEDLALLAILISDEVKIKHRVAALISR